jgi:serpin B
MRLIICASLVLAVISGSMAQSPDRCGQLVTENSNAFAFRFLKANYNNDINFVVSPLSVSTVNSMLIYGAEGSTRDELNSIQKTPLDNECLAEGTKSFMAVDSPTANDSVEFDIANGAWFNQNINIKSSFSAFLREELKAHIENVDFDHDALATQKINEFFSEKTHGKIERIFEEDLPMGTDWVIGNACYFKGNWQIPFKVSQTKNETFNTAAGKPVTVPFMRNELMYRFNGHQDFTLLAIPYVGNRFSFVICMPSGNNSVAQLMEVLDENKFFTLLSTARKTKLTLHLPKFTLREKYDLIGIYESWGVSEPFSPQANFNGITDRSSEIREFWHSVFIQVDEKGTEAAAVTAAASYRSMPEHYVVNKPFFFAVVDEINQIILFAGVVNDPTLSNP